LIPAEFNHPPPQKERENGTRNREKGRRGERGGTALFPQEEEAPWPPSEKGGLICAHLWTTHPAPKSVITINTLEQHSPQPVTLWVLPIKGEGVIMKFLLPWWEKARMRGIS